MIWLSSLVHFLGSRLDFSSAEWLVWLLPGLATLVPVCVAQRAWPEGYWKYRGWGTAGAVLWYFIWIAIRFAAAAAGMQPEVWLSKALLRGCSALGNLLFSWPFLVSAGLLILLRKQLPPLVRRISQRLNAVEVGGVKLSLGAPAPTGVELSAGWWSDGFSVGDSLADVPAGDGTLKERPDTPSPAYADCLTTARLLLATVDDSTQETFGDQIKANEKKWHGEYREWLVLTVDLIWQALTEKRLSRVNNQFLATCLTVRHILLYLNGEADQADNFFRALEVVDPKHARGTISRPMGYWFLTRLCDRGQFEAAARLVGHGLLQASGMEETRAAYGSYLNFRLGKYTEAVALATAPCPPQNDTAELMRKSTAARALQRLDRPLEAFQAARQALAVPIKKPSAFSRYVRLHALRAYARACVELHLYAPLVTTILDTEGAADDAFVCNAVAVYLAGIGQRQVCDEWLARSLAVVGADGGLRETILANQKKLRAADDEE